MTEGLARHGVCVVGGGPAGLATAIALRQKGISVTVLDCAEPPVDKACGEGLLPEALLALQSLGIEIDHRQGFRFHGIRFVDQHSDASVDFPAGCALALRRTQLHQLLLRRATALDVQLNWSKRHIRVVPSGVLAEGRLIPSSLVIGADGGSSFVRKNSGLDAGARVSHRYGFRRHYAVEPWFHHVEVHWSDSCQVYLTPVSHDQVSVSVVSRDSSLRVDQALQRFPHLAHRLRNAPEATRERGALSTMRILPSVFRGRVALVGDASGSVDVITGEGLGLAFQHALALASAVASGSLVAYAKAHRRINRRPRMMAQLLLTLAGHPQLRQRALASLASHPTVFASLMALHVGDASWQAFCTAPWLRFGLGLLSA